MRLKTDKNCQFSVGLTNGTKKRNERTEKEKSMSRNPIIGLYSKYTVFHKIGTPLFSCDNFFNF